MQFVSTNRLIIICKYNINTNSKVKKVSVPLSFVLVGRMKEGLLTLFHVSLFVV